MDWEIRHCDNADPHQGLPSLADDAVDHCITDPPYTPHTHDKQRRGSLSGEHGISRSCDLGFAAITQEQRVEIAAQCARVVKRWSIVFTDDWGLSDWFAAFEAASLEVVRSAVWIKQGCTPQFTGDRPASGHEMIVIAHRKGRKKWNGGGKRGVYACPVVSNGKQQRLHTTQKPLALMQSLVRDFTDADELILDPFAGSGTTIAAARSCGRRGLGMERSADYARTAQARLRNTREQIAMF